jgi:hypothetical protein
MIGGLPAGEFRQSGNCSVIAAPARSARATRERNLTSTAHHFERGRSSRHQLDLKCRLMQQQVEPTDHNGSGALRRRPERRRPWVVDNVEDDLRPRVQLSERAGSGIGTTSRDGRDHQSGTGHSRCVERPEGHRDAQPVGGSKQIACPRWIPDSDGH